MTVIGPALPHKWQSAESGREQYARGRTDGSVPVVGCSRFSCAEFVQSRDAALSDDVGLHLEFGRRFFLFTVQRNASNEVSAESARERVRTVTEVLISSATITAVHWTWRWTNSHGPIIEYLRLGFPLDLCDSGGLKKKKPDRPYFFAGCYPNLTIFSVRPYENLVDIYIYTPVTERDT